MEECNINILLVNPPFTFSKKESNNPPLGLLYLASYLESQGHTVHILDSAILNLTIPETIDKILSYKNIDYIGFTSTTTTINKVKEITDKLNTDAKIVIGGSHLSAVPSKTMQFLPKINYGIIGEGEITFSELCSNKLPQQINGITYRDFDNNIITNSPREYTPNLDILPFPARHLLPNLKQYHSGLKTLRKPVASMITSRGCPYNCIFCYKGVFGNKYRYHSPEYVYNEVLHLIENYNIKEVTFYDDNFVLLKPRLLSICDLLKTLDITWSCLGRINIDKESLKNMHEAGCWNIAYGIESGNQNILDIIKKDITIPKIKETIIATKKAGIEAKGYFMLGLPLETESSIRETINLAKSLPFDSVEFAITVPYVGTELYSIADKYGTFDKEIYNNYLSLFPENVIFKPFNLSEEVLKSSQRTAYQEFYLRPSYILKRMMKPNQLIKNLKGLKFIINQVS